MLAIRRWLTPSTSLSSSKSLDALRKLLLTRIQEGQSLGNRKSETWNAEVVGAKSKLPVTGGTNRELSGHFENQCRISKIHLIAVT